MKQNLQLRISQNLALTPQLQQSIKLLQMSSLELNQELELILQENPLLELLDADNPDSDLDEADALPEQALEADADAPDADDVDDTYSPLDYQETSTSTLQETPENTAPTSDEFNGGDFDEESAEYGSASNWDEASKQSNSDDDDGDFTRQEIVTEDLREHLLSQLKLMPLSERDQKLMLLLIDSINEDGYLEESLEEMVDSLPLELEVDLLELQTALKHIQNLDPPGIGATNLQECILLQLNVLPKDTPDLETAKNIVEKHLAVLANKDFIKLRKLLNCNETELKSKTPVLAPVLRNLAPIILFNTKSL